MSSPFVPEMKREESATPAQAKHLIVGWNVTGDRSVSQLMTSSKMGSLGGLGADQDDAEDKQDCPGKSRQTRRVLWNAEQT
jgi:hypothetical protein